MKKTLIFILLIVCTLTCNHPVKLVNLKVFYDTEKKYLTIENFLTKHKYGFYNIGYKDLYENYGYKDPVYCIDSLNKLLYLYDIGSLRGIKIYNIKNDSLIKEIAVNSLREEQYNIKMFCLNDQIILKSNWRCDIWDREFSRKISLKDTTYSNYPICYRYTLDYIPLVKNDTLFLTVCYEGGIVDTLIHKSDYIYDLKKRDFITKIEPCNKVLSKGIP